MAITSIKYIVLRKMREQGALPLNADLLELGEANWYGDVPLDQLEASIPEFAKQDDQAPLLTDYRRLYDTAKAKQGQGDSTTREMFEIAKLFWRTFLQPRSMTHIDLNGTEVALKQDLNQPFDLGRQFGFVTNIGTAEHVFNIGQVFETIHRHCRPGGLMFHVMPFSGWIDHGFYCIQPTFYWDLAAANGYNIRAMLVAEMKPLKFHELKTRDAIAELAHSGALGQNSLITVVYEMGANPKPFEVPMQGYYAGTLSKTGEATWYDFR